MIHVTLQPEPRNFHAKVRIPGLQFRARNPTPTNRQWKQAKAEYWKRCLPQLLRSYRTICAYSAIWLPGQSASVDHFQPKSRFHDLAYEWSNFRLSHQRINGYKADSIGIQDPFLVEAGWFVLDFDSFNVKAGSGLPHDDEQRVLNTILVLRLNEDPLVQQRFKIVEAYAHGTPIEDVERYYPFVALELRRQGLTEAIKTSFGA